jgi:diketogulonate reductase-like aldo/keto reductase
MHTRPIPSSGVPLPVVGCGTWRAFDVTGSREERERLGGVVRTLLDYGGSVIDSSPMYGRAEAVVGGLLAAHGWHDRVFLATKVWTSGKAAGIAQMQRSLALLGSGAIALLQVHNLLDWRTQLASLREWQQEGRIAYLGVTHYSASAHDQLEQVMRAERLDFVQLNYAIDDPAADKRLLPLASERGIAVLVNRPFGGGALLGRLAGRPLPAWAAELSCRTWAQILLKFVLGHPAVTCAIPGTGRPEHMRDNALAGCGSLPDARLRARMAAVLT